jgi:arginase
MFMKPPELRGIERNGNDYTSRMGPAEDARKPTPAKVAVFGVPSAAGGRHEALADAPRALREAGLLVSLRGAGLRVVNLSDLSLFPYRDDPAHPRARNAEVVACAVRATADEMARALAEGFTVVLGGDCTLVAGLVGGAWAALGRPVGLVYLDANADLNTPDTSPSGYLSGMALALTLGRAPGATSATSSPAVLPEHVALVGYRALDPSERHAIGDLGLALPAVAAKELGMRAAAALALDAIENGDGPVVVHLDVDLVDAGEMPAKDAITPGVGLTWAEASDLVTALLASPRVMALEVCEYQPAKDKDLVLGQRLVELIVRAVARHARA